jgi:hypothetical protein
MPIFQLLLQRGSSLELKSHEGFPPLWYALQNETESNDMATQLILKGASPDTVSIQVKWFL